MIIELEKARSSKNKKELFFKALAWRGISIAITYFLTYMTLGDVKSATTFTLFLHFFLFISNYIFELFWDRHFD